MSHVLTVNEAAAMLKVHRITLYRLIRAGQMPAAFKVGRTWRVDGAALERFLNSAGKPGTKGN